MLTWQFRGIGPFIGCVTPTMKGHLKVFHWRLALLNMTKQTNRINFRSIREFKIVCIPFFLLKLKKGGQLKCKFKEGDDTKKSKIKNPLLPARQFLLLVYHSLDLFLRANGRSCGRVLDFQQAKIRTISYVRY